VRGFEDNFKGDWIHAGRRGKDAVIMVVNDPVPSGEAINGRVDVSRQDLSGFAQRWTQQILL